MKPCNECPFLKSSEQGKTTHREESKGTFDSAKHMAFGNLNMCHKNTENVCRGSICYTENSVKANRHKEVFNNPYDFLDHHCYKETFDDLRQKRADFLLALANKLL